jgi:hypothetical protein
LLGVRPLVLESLWQISGLTARVDELVARNKALLVCIAELEAEHGKPPKNARQLFATVVGQKGNVAEPTRAKKARKGRPGAARALAEHATSTPSAATAGANVASKATCCHTGLG